MLDFSRPGKPTDNAFIEAFNGRFRAECLNAHLFLSLADAQKKVEDWRIYYNEERPHGSIRRLASLSDEDTVRNDEDTVRNSGVGVGYREVGAERSGARRRALRSHNARHYQLPQPDHQMLAKRLPSRDRSPSND
jgi:putative transposase